MGDLKLDAQWTLPALTSTKLGGRFLTVENLIVLALTTLASAFIGSYLASYLKKKGENLATHEDLDKLVEEVRAVTTTTKEIEAKISTGVWDRQKRWEMKRDVLFEATKRLGALEAALIELHSACEVERQRLQRNEPVSSEAKVQASDKWIDKVNQFGETGLLVRIVCGKEMQMAFHDFRSLAGQVAAGIYDNDPKIYSNSSQELVAKSRAVTSAIRKELEADKTA
jgi:hypothetical protein